MAVDLLFSKGRSHMSTLKLLFDVSGGAFHMNYTIPRDDKTPIVVVVPGLTSDSAAAYIKHFSFKMAKRGWNVVVSNHRGLGGISITSDCFYNAGWTEDIRKVIGYLHCEYPESPLYAVGTSIGANVLVKYLGEDGDNVPVAGAVAICSPWDLLIGDRFICRRLVQKFYDRVLAIGLQGYAQLYVCDTFLLDSLDMKFVFGGCRYITLSKFSCRHQPIYSRLADWEGILKSRSIRDFDNYATCLVGKFETVDTYYRRCSSASFVGNVSVPLLCISALDDPVCTREAIPWDECRANKNIVLATPRHGGHLAFFEGITAASLWYVMLSIFRGPSICRASVQRTYMWVRAVDEFLGVLHSSPYMHRQKECSILHSVQITGNSLVYTVCCLVLQTQNSDLHCSLESSIDRGPYVNVTEDGMVTAMGCEQTGDGVVEDFSNDQMIHNKKTDLVSNTEQNEHKAEAKTDFMHDIIQPSEQDTRSDQDVKYLHDVTAPVRRCIDQLSRQNRRSMWLLVYIAIITTWPLVGSALFLVFKRKLKNFLPAALLRR
ncbi:hypothetical protein HHK36_004408 [Tetracentron sinense]|uniref:AB hydrolase-1 domain-containing protein n=1 Tax=Tetracentron sinense TaxID=13715 RepID=A0A834ZQK5_TETSI|nr:hypothetical protein HHK36_004408 [Tetracentron sinense]